MSTIRITTPTPTGAEWVGLRATIVKGEGFGQTVSIAGYNPGSQELVLVEPLRVPPEPGAQIAIGTQVKNVVIYDNDLEARDGVNTSPTHVGSVGVQPYGGCINFIVARNRFTGFRTGIAL